MNVSALIAVARSHTERPILDATGLGGEYDWVLQWDTKAGDVAFQNAVRDLGLESVGGDEPAHEVGKLRLGAGGDGLGERTHADDEV